MMHRLDQYAVSTGHFAEVPAVVALQVTIRDGHALTAHIRDWLRSAKLTPIQQVATRLAPQALQLAASIRHTIDGAFLLGAAVLVRPLVERVALLSYLSLNPTRISDWQNNWKGVKRPTFEEMVRTLQSGLDEIGLGDSKTLLHGLVHGNLDCEWAGAIKVGDGHLSYAAHQMPTETANACYFAMHAAIAVFAMLNFLPRIYLEAFASKNWQEMLQACTGALLFAATQAIQDLDDASMESECPA